jgi:sugar phosphate isomerase/epimerase
MSNDLQQKDMSRRTFLAATTTAAILPPPVAKTLWQRPSTLRLGGPVSAPQSPMSGQPLKALGYRAAYCPVETKASDAVVKAYEDAAKKADIAIAEVGAWGNNPISPDEKTRKESIANCQAKLALAERIGARCCVNVCGSRNLKSWAGQHPDNLTDETFDMIVESVRAIIDGVKPTRTFYTVETGMWWYPISADSYLRLIKAIDRKQFGVRI